MKMNSALVMPITSPMTLITKNNGFRFRNCQLKCRFFRNIGSPHLKTPRPPARLRPSPPRLLPDEIRADRVWSHYADECSRDRTPRENDGHDLTYYPLVRTTITKPPTLCPGKQLPSPPAPRFFHRARTA